MAIPKKAFDNIVSSITPLKNIIKQGLKTQATESDTRSIVEKTLEILGWDMFDYSTEQRKNESIDYVINLNGNKLLAIEVKSIETELKEQHLKKAKEYAIDEAVNYVALTNGNRWMVYHVELGADNLPHTVLVFETTIADEEIKKKDKAEALALLAKAGFKKKVSELDSYYEYYNALSPEKVLNAILSERCINGIRNQLRHDTRQSLTNREVAEAVVRSLVKEEHVSEATQRKVSRL